jgi:hypothetical protein
LVPVSERADGGRRQRGSRSATTTRKPVGVDIRDLPDVFGVERLQYPRYGRHVDSGEVVQVNRERTNGHA